MDGNVDKKIAIGLGILLCCAAIGSLLIMGVYMFFYIIGAPGT